MTSNAATDNLFVSITIFVSIFILLFSYWFLSWLSLLGHRLDLFWLKTPERFRALESVAWASSIHIVASRKLVGIFGGGGGATKGELSPFRGIIIPACGSAGAMGHPGEAGPRRCELC